VAADTTEVEAKSSVNSEAEIIAISLEEIFRLQKTFHNPSVITVA